MTENQIKPPVNGAYEFIERHIRKVESIAVRPDGSVSIMTFGKKTMEFKTIAEADTEMGAAGL